MKYLKLYENFDFNENDFDYEEFDLLPITNLYIYVKKDDMNEFEKFMTDKGFKVDKYYYSGGNGFIYTTGRWKYVGLTTNPVIIKNSPELIKFKEVKELY